MLRHLSIVSKQQLNVFSIAEVYATLLCVVVSMNTCNTIDSLDTSFPKTPQLDIYFVLLLRKQELSCLKRRSKMSINKFAFDIYR